MQSGDGRITVTVWHDNKDVRVISTNSGSGNGTCQRRIDKELKTIPIPVAIKKYNLKMGGVDMMDQRRSYYIVPMKCRKVWKYFMWACWEFAINNAWVLYSKVCEG